MRIVLWVLLTISVLGGVLPAVAQGNCCPDRVGATSIEGWFLHNNAHLSIGFWPNAATYTGVGVAPGSPIILDVKVARIIRQACTSNIYIGAILMLPLVQAMNWQTLNLGISVEFCSPRLPNFALEIGVGFYISHYLVCHWYKGCWWEWSGGAFTFFALKYYFG